MSDFSVQTLLNTATVTVRDVCCAGHCWHQSAEECAGATELVFPYRGVYARHLGRDQAIAEANHDIDNVADFVSERFDRLSAVNSNATPRDILERSLSTRATVTTGPNDSSR